MNKVNYLSCEDLSELIIKSTDFCLLDVRSKAEFNEKHILGSSSIPRSDLEFQLPRLIPYKHTKIILNDSDSKRSFSAFFNCPTLSKLVPRRYKISVYKG